MTQEKNDGKEKRDPFDGDYIGNIWGWKFSLFGAGLILFFLALILFRYFTADPEELKDKPLFQVEWPMESDSSTQED